MTSPLLDQLYRPGAAIAAPFALEAIGKYPEHVCGGLVRPIRLKTFRADQY